jgi:uncharacterized protein YcnI
MKKILIANIAALFFASSAFAAATHAITANSYADAGKTVYGAKASASAGAAGTKAIGKLSTGVDFALKTSTSGYALITAHKNGNKSYGSSHDSTAIYMKDISKGDAVAAPSAIGSTDFVASGSGWSTM